MQIIDFESGPIDTKCYLIIDAAHNAVLIDAAPESFDKVIDLCHKNNAELKAVILTHSHWDHSMDAAKFQSETKAEIYINQLDEYRITDPMSNTIWKLPFQINACTADKYLADGDVLKISDMEFRIVHTPGHTEGGVCLILDSKRSVFVGDTLFNDGIGRTDLPGGDFGMLKNSIISKLYTLPDDYVVYPGHGESTILGYEKHNNSYIRIPI